MQKKRVHVQIEGRNYVVISSDETSYVKSVADEVTNAIRKAAQHGKNLDTRDCAVLAALDFCDDRNRAERRNQDVVDKADKIIRQSADLSKQCKEYKEKLTASINENITLTRRVKAMEEQLRVLLRENEKLKKTAEAVKPDAEERFERAVRDKKKEKQMGVSPMKQYSLFDGEDD